MELHHDLPLEEYHHAGVAITNGNAGVYKRLYSRRDDVTLANPFGPPVRGWSQVEARLDAAAANFRDGEAVAVENVVTSSPPNSRTLSRSRATGRASEAPRRSRRSRCE